MHPSVGALGKLTNGQPHLSLNAAFHGRKDVRAEGLIDECWLILLAVKIKIQFN